jgi:hypothetical protein
MVGGGIHQEEKGEERAEYYGTTSYVHMKIE